LPEHIKEVPFCDVRGGAADLRHRLGDHSIDFDEIPDYPA